jgi:hypothetical protein
MAVVLAPAQTVWLGTAVNTGIGFTVMVNVCGEPIHPLKLGVAVKFPMAAVAPALRPMNEAMSPLPVVPIPMEALSLVQFTVAVAGVCPKTIAVVELPAQSVCGGTPGIDGIGFMVMLNVCGAPVQPNMVGVATKLPVTGTVPAFTPVKAAILPVPVAAAPIVLSLLVQFTVAPTGAVVYVMALVLAPAHTVWLVTADNTGIGFTVMVNVCGGPTQVPITGVAVKLPEMPAAVALVPVKEAISPIPEVATPMAPLLLVQLMVAIPGVGAKLIAAVDVVAQTV